jgi:hypothetical protein
MPRFYAVVVGSRDLPPPIVWMSMWMVVVDVCCGCLLWMFVVDVYVDVYVDVF